MGLGGTIDNSAWSCIVGEQCKHLLFLSNNWLFNFHEMAVVPALATAWGLHFPRVLQSSTDVWHLERLQRTLCAICLAITGSARDQLGRLKMTSSLMPSLIFPIRDSECRHLGAHYNLLNYSLVNSATRENRLFQGGVSKSSFNQLCVIYRNGWLPTLTRMAGLATKVVADITRG